MRENNEIYTMTINNGHRYTKNDDAHILLTCEHASDYIPEEYDLLGMCEVDLQNSKDLFDPGSKEVTELLAKKLNASALYADFSRLVIDCNRRLDAVTKNDNTYHSCALKRELLVEDMEGERMLQIPKNCIDCSDDFAKEELERYGRYAVPYIQTAHDLVRNMRKKHEKSYLVQIHSFFPTYNGDERTVDISVLYDRSESTAQRVIDHLRGRTDLYVAGNDPWDMRDTDGVVFTEADKSEDVEIIAFDVNNKHLRDKEGIKKISNLICDALRAELVPQ